MNESTEWNGITADEKKRMLVIFDSIAATAEGWTGWSEE